MNNIVALRQQVNLFDEEYEKGNPLISDTEYEEKYSELQKLEVASGVVSPDSPTQRITYLKVPGLETVKHKSPKLSLDKINDYNGLKKWYSPENGPVMAEHKMDGVTIVPHYFGGELVNAVLRGNGLEGDQVLHIAQTIKNLPQKINFKGALELRGEAYIPFVDYERVNAGLPAKSRYANSRALATGTIRMLDAAIAAERGLAVKIFNLEYAEGQNFTSWVEQRQFLAALGFPLVDTHECRSLEELASYCANFESEKRQSLPYLVDGLVVKYSDLSVRKKLGQTSKYYNWGRAYKFESEDAVTTVKDIIVQIGKTGQVTPVAIYEPTEIGGNINNRATLHNPTFVLENDVRVGDRIVVARANDVIPQVIKSYPELREEDLPKWELPPNCPECNSLIRLDGALAYCTGENCPGQLVAQLIHYCSREAFDIEGIGKSTAKLLFDMGFIKTPADFYSLYSKADEINELEGFGDKKLDKILESIENTKTQPLSKALYALNISHLGRTNSRILAEKFLTIDALMASTREQLLRVDGIGDIGADTILDFFSKEKNQTLISRLKDAGVTFTEEAPAVVSEELPLSGKTLVITGTLSIKRAEVEDIIRANGGKPSGSVSKNTDYVILGPDKSGTAKHKKAMELGVAIISEAEFLKILEGGKA